jgi:glycosyltransferase involved in cell wall biosynthesis
MVAGIVVPSGREKQFTALGWGEYLSSVAGNPVDPQNKWFDELPVELVTPKDSFSTRRELYGSASVLLHYFPAYEAFPFAIAIAMLTGVAVVSSPSPAALELIEHGETGFIADSADEAAYRTSRLAWSPSKRDEVAVRAYKWLISKGPGNPDICLNWWGPIMSWQTTTTL